MSNDINFARLGSRHTDAQCGAILPDQLRKTALKLPQKKNNIQSLILLQNSKELYQFYLQNQTMIQNRSV